MEKNSPRILGNTHWDGLRGRQLYIAMAALLCGLFFSVMDGTVCNVALPTLSRELNIAPSESIWIVNAFQIVIVMMLLPFASLGELISYRKIYLIGITLFTSGSLLCAMAASFGGLVTARVVQGLGAAMVMSINTSLVKLIYPKKHLGKGIGLNATVVALGLVAGPVITGAILSVATWHWLFIINLPFGLIAFLLARKSLPENPTKVEGRHFDYREALLNALTFGLFFACFEAFSNDVAEWILLIGVALFLLTATVYVRYQQHREFPMLPLDLLQSSIFSLSIITSIVSFASQTLAMVGMPFLLMHSFGYDAVQTGVLMTAYPIVILVIAPISGFLIGRVSPELLGCFGLLMLCIGSFLLAFLPADCGFWDIVWRFAVCGLGFGFFQSPNNHLILSAAPTHRAGSASGMMASARLVGQTTGAACVAMAFRLFDDKGPMMTMVLGGMLSLAGMLSSLARYIDARHK